MPTTPPAEAPNAPSATIAATTVAGPSTQLVPEPEEQGSPTQSKAHESPSGRIHDGSRLKTPSEPSEPSAGEEDDVDELLFDV